MITHKIIQLVKVYGMIDEVLKKYGLEKETVTISPLTQGLINTTWKISTNGNSYILQKINNQVYKRPEDHAAIKLFRR